MAIQTGFPEGSMLAHLKGINIPEDWAKIIDSAHVVHDELENLRALGTYSLHSKNVERDLLAAVCSVYLAQVLRELGQSWDPQEVISRASFWEKINSLTYALLTAG